MTLNVLGILHNFTKGLRKIHTTFGGFGLFDLSTEQLISRVNMIFQHYHVSTNLSKKLDASLGYLQLQLGTPHNPFTQDYSKWGCLTPLSWVKMLWKSIHHFNITLYMFFPTIKLPRERDQAIMEIIFAQNLDPTDINRINRCCVHLQAIFLSDITMADGTYLKDFVFNPGEATAWSQYTFPQEQPSRCNWDQWINFWHEYSSTGGKLKILLGGWINPTNRIWHWYYNKEQEELYHISETKIKYFKQASGWRCTRSTTTYKLTHAEMSAKISTTGIPTSVI
jgi:hypothetical protein